MPQSPSQSNVRDRYLSERRGSRFEVTAACRFWWPSLDGESAFGLGQTTELGSCGLSVLTSVLPPLGSPIMLEVDLPRLDMNLAELALPEVDLPALPDDLFLLLTAEGSVVRHHRQGKGFDAVMTQTSFSHQEKRRPA